MKIFLSSNTVSLGDETMIKDKVKLHVDGQDVENIWVVKDIANNKMYLFNHAVNFYPFPSWGTEWPLGDEINIAEARGKSVDDTVLIMHSEAYDHIKHLLNGDELDLDKFFYEEDAPNE